MNGETIDAEVSENALALTHEAMPTDGLQSVVSPIVTPEEARERWNQYRAICAAVLDASDYQRVGEKLFKKKSAVKKLQTFFGISVALVKGSLVRDDLGDGHFGFRLSAIATAPNGRHIEALGGCSTFEERFDLQRYDGETEDRYSRRVRKANARAYHDVISTAETRTTNRAVMNLIGAGEVTADEIRDIGKAQYNNAETPVSRAKVTRANVPIGSEEYRERLRKRVLILCRELKMSDDDRHDDCLSRYHTSSTNDLTTEQLLDYGHYLSKLASEQSA